MAEFLNNIKDNLSSVTDPNQIINKGIDRDRTTFLKGLKTTSSGQKEDPTYTGFRIMFDMGYGGLVDPETYLPISPLFSSGSNEITGPIKGMKTPEPIPTDFFHLSRNKIEYFPNYTGQMQYMTAEGYLKERRTLEENGLTGAVRDANGQIIQTDASQSKSGRLSYRAEALKGFKNLLTSINDKSPWFIQTIDGLSDVLKINIPRQIGGSNGYREQRSGVLTFNCLDSIDLRVNAMADLYRKATYDYQYQRETLPSNLRKFRMWIIVTEIRQMDLQKNLADVLNPFNLPGIRSSAENIRDIAQGTGLLDGGANESKNPGRDLESFIKSFEKLTPYILMYQLDLCEFNFDESYPFTTLTNAKNDNPVSSRFKINVGSVREYKLQYNILSDLLKNESIFAPLLVQDSWNLAGSKILLDGINFNNNPDLFTRISNNFINNSIASVVQQQISPIVTRQLLGNAYGFNLSDAIRAINSAPDLVNGIKNIKSPFQDYRPQTRGLGGPGERNYPTISEDVYPDQQSNPNPNLGSLYGPGQGPGTLGENDVYPNNPGSDLGLPGRNYPEVKEDVYRNVGGDLSNSDLGVPDFKYNTPELKQDAYPNNPGSDLGLPKRVYGTINDDAFPGVPGNDLGVPQRIYPDVKDDVYASVPGSSLGLPGRVYNTVKDDVFPGVPGNDLGAPGRIYPDVKNDVYSSVPGSDLGLPGRIYDTVKQDVFPGTPGNDLGAPVRIYPTISDDVYE